MTVHMHIRKHLPYSMYVCMYVPCVLHILCVLYVLSVLHILCVLYAPGVLHILCSLYAAE